MPAHRYHHSDLLTFGCRVLERLGVAAEQAREVAACLVKAELRGVDSHGMVRLPVYAQRIKAGVVNARPEIRLTKTSSATVLVDGDNGLGPVVGARAMEAALDLASSHGIPRRITSRRRLMPGTSASRSRTPRRTWRRTEERSGSSAPIRSPSAFPRGGNVR
jgi:LDH2 family malate/lactate/ureidoglycolate dehydrogenase